MEELQGIEAFTGSMVHLALQHLHEEASKGRILEQTELVELFRHLWKEHYDESTVAVVKKGESSSDHLMRGSIGLVAYHRRYHPFDQGSTVGLEHEIKFKVRGEREHEFIGYIDRLTERDNGVLEIHDYKTGQRAPTAQQLRTDRQLALYEIGVRQNYPYATEVRLIWHYVSHDKEYSSSRSPEELLNLEASVASLVERIEGTEHFRCNRGPLCRWCEYQEICH